MCILSCTSYKGCGCARKHATLPCPRAFYKELLQCDPRSYELANEVEGDCPECKPAFDNKSGLEPLVTLNSESSRRQRNVMQEVHPEHPGPQFPTSTTSASASSTPKPKKDPPVYRPMSSNPRQMIRDRLERYRIQRYRRPQRGIITPPATMERTLSVPVTDWYTITARHYILSADQREALRRSGRHNIRRLSVISRSPKRSSDTSSSEHVSSTRHVTLSASQRAALARRGRGNIRKLSIVGH